jgi:hypothetical protein
LASSTHDGSHAVGDLALTKSGVSADDEDFPARNATRPKPIYRDSLNIRRAAIFNMGLGIAPDRAIWLSLGAQYWQRLDCGPIGFLVRLKPVYSVAAIWQPQLVDVNARNIGLEA